MEVAGRILQITYCDAGQIVSLDHVLDDNRSYQACMPRSTAALWPFAADSPAQVGPPGGELTSDAGIPYRGKTMRYRTWPLGLPNPVDRHIEGGDGAGRPSAYPAGGEVTPTSGDTTPLLGGNTVQRKTRNNALLISAVSAFALASALAVVDGVVSGRAFAVGAVGLGIATVALAMTTRQAAGELAIAVKRAPRDQYYRGYGDAVQDALSGCDDATPLTPGLH